ncbi:MAG: DUF4258 domain-containing protein [Acidobacteriota bacterium]
MKDTMLDRVRKAAAKRILFLSHAVRQMSRPDRMISVAEVKRVIQSGEIIEDYPEDARGHSCLMLGFGDEGRPIHVVCAPKPEFLAIITTYMPSDDEWDSELKVRRRI